MILTDSERDYEIVIETQRAEVGRLKTALQAIADHPKDCKSPGKSCGFLMRAIARAALEGKP